MFSMNSAQFSNLSAKRVILAALCLMLLSIVSLGMPSNAGADSVVTTIDDDENDGCLVGDCSLREAIEAENAAGGTITFAPGLAGTITLLGDDIYMTILNSMTIIGPTATSITVDCDGDLAAFAILGGSTPTVFIRNLTFTGCRVAVYGSTAIMDIAGSTFTGNGLAIFNTSGTLTVANSTFSDNASFSGAEVGLAAAVGTSCLYSDTTLIVGNNTFGENEGICIENDGGTALLANNILSSTVEDSENCSGTITDIGNNIDFNADSGPTCGFGGAISTEDPLLGPLALNGGPTQTMVPQAGSPALSAGNAAVCAAAPVNGLDQRGVARLASFCDIGAVEVNDPAKNATLTANFPSPHVAAGLTFTANATCPVGSCEYKWMKYNYATLSWTTIYDYPAAHGNSLSGADVGVGNWAVRVVARNSGSSSSYGETQTQVNYSIVTKVPASGGYIGTTKPSPNIAAGLQIWAGATSQGPFEQKFMLFNKGTNTWTTLQDYPSQNATINAPALAPGIYVFRVYIRNVGSLAEVETQAQMDYEIVANAPAIATSLKPNRPSPQAANVVTLTATATGGTGNYEYKFDVANPIAARMTICDWSGTNTCSLASVPPGTYKLRVWVRNVGSTSTLGESSITLNNYTVVGPATGATLTPNYPSGEGVNSAVFTAGGVGGLGTYEYRFERSTNGTDWTVIQDFPSTNNLFKATSIPPGAYTLRIKVKNRYAPGSGEASTDISYTLVGPATNASVSADLSSPNLNSVVYTGTATCPDGPCDYQFLVYDYDGKTYAAGTWNTLQAFSTDDTVTGAALSPGNYAIRVYARNSNSLVSETVSGLLYFTIVASLPATNADLIADPLNTGLMAAVTFTASATCTGGCEYQFQKSPTGAAGTFTNIGIYSTNNILLGTDVGSPGTWTIRVWVRNVGSSAQYETFKRVNNYIIQ